MRFFQMINVREIVRIDNTHIALIGEAEYEDGTRTEQRLECRLERVIDLTTGRITPIGSV